MRGCLYRSDDDATYTVFETALSFGVPRLRMVGRQMISGSADSGCRSDTAEKRWTVALSEAAAVAAIAAGGEAGK